VNEPLPPTIFTWLEAAACCVLPAVMGAPHLHDAEDGLANDCGKQSNDLVWRMPNGDKEDEQLRLTRNM